MRRGSGQEKPAEALNEERVWDFDHYGDAEGWTVPAALEGVVMGGALCLRIAPGEKVRLEEGFEAKRQIYPGPPAVIVSPAGLGLAASRAYRLEMRIQNLSPETDIAVSCRDARGRETARVVLAMKPYTMGISNCPAARGRTRHM